jgi:hypothetical protein
VRYFIYLQRAICQECTKLFFITGEVELLLLRPLGESGSLRRQLAENVRSCLHQLCSLLDQAVGATAGPERYIARNGKNFPSLLKGKAGSDERAAFFGSLYHQNPPRKTADDPVPAREIRGIRRCADRELADYAAFFSHLLKKLAIFGWVYQVDTAAKYADGGACSLQSCPVCGSINPLGKTGDNGNALLGKFARQSCRG